MNHPMNHPHFCKDCRHRSIHRDVPDNIALSLCRRIATGPNPEYLVTGEHEIAYMFCTNARGDFGSCGPEAKLFEPLDTSGNAPAQE